MLLAQITPTEALGRPRYPIQIRCCRLPSLALVVYLTSSSPHLLPSSPPTAFALNFFTLLLSLPFFLSPSSSSTNETVCKSFLSLPQTSTSIHFPTTTCRPSYSRSHQSFDKTNNNQSPATHAPAIKPARVISPIITVLSPPTKSPTVAALAETQGVPARLVFFFFFLVLQASLHAASQSQRTVSLTVALHSP